MRGLAIALPADDLRSASASTRRARLVCVLAAGLLAAAAPTAQAICAVDEEGGCSAIAHSLDLDITDECPEPAPLCIVDNDGNLSQAPNDAEWDIALHNRGASAVTVELHAIGFYGEDGEPVTGDRVASRLLATIGIPAGASASLEGVAVPADVSHVRVQAMSGAGDEGEVDAELMNYRILMMEPGEPEPAVENDPADDDAAAKDAPAPAFLLVVLALGALAVAAGFRRE